MQGVGVLYFTDTPKANSFVFNKEIMTGSEWVNALKLIINYAPLRGVPGVSGSVANAAESQKPPPMSWANVLTICHSSCAAITTLSIGSLTT
ncbi:hypothetical protein O3M35_011494 [Rhynocoris fuscipes]|uniref:Uncharacterized protein n=1 Tax=Rhynocoris fuscipes TaxID=488301 RepID=A0AAW1D0Y3_9HEMI